MCRCFETADSAEGICVLDVAVSKRNHILQNNWLLRKQCFKGWPPNITIYYVYVYTLRERDLQITFKNVISYILGNRKVKK